VSEASASGKSEPDAGRGSRVRVRSAEPGDLPKLWDLVAGLARYERLESFFTGSAERLGANLFGDGWPRIEGLVAESEGELVGYAIFYPVYSTFWTRPMLWLEDLYVADSRRGTGVGKRLLAAVARVALERDCVRVDWAVLDWNTEAIGFYENLGATRASGWHSYRIEGEAMKALARSE
jgi:GNAT superfamily N-acetyltransferase